MVGAVLAVTQRSRAAVAAEQASGETRRASSQWPLAKVERVAVTLLEVERLPEFEEDLIRARVAAFVRFEKLVASGAVDADAVSLARAVIARMRKWLAANSWYAPVKTQPWSVEMIEQLIAWFQHETREPVDEKRAVSVVDRVHVFERVVRNGGVDHDTDARSLADAFLDYARSWMHRQPAALAHYDSL
jgi:hypothetical protein